MKRSKLKQLWAWAQYNAEPLTATILAVAVAIILGAVLTGCLPEGERTTDLDTRALACDLAALRMADNCEAERLESGIDYVPEYSTLEDLRTCRYFVEGERAECYGAFDKERAREVHCNARCENNYRGVEVELRTGRYLGATYAQDARHARAACEVFCASGGVQ
jgi:hypothetical protein